MENRRKHPRIPVVATARLTRQGAQDKTFAIVRDISAQGIGIHTKEAYQKGELLFVYISIVTDDKETMNEVLIGKVAWVAPGKEETEMKYMVGLVFDKMDLEKPKLYAYIKQLENAFNH